MALADCVPYLVFNVEYVEALSQFVIDYRVSLIYASNAVGILTIRIL